MTATADSRPQACERFCIAEHLVLGTAQFGLPYGRNRNGNPPDDNHVADLLDAAWAVGIRAFDTAAAYGTAASRLGRWIHTRHRASLARVTTKVTCDDSLTPGVLESALAPFLDCGDTAILSHSISSLPSWHLLCNYGHAHGMLTGRSVYTAEEIRCGVNDGATYFQAPGSIFDTRCIEAARSLPCKLDLRSVYLQGTLLDAPPLAERRAPGTGALASAAQTAAADVGYPAAALLLAATALLANGRSQLVIGIDSAADLNAALVAAEISPLTVQTFLDRVRCLMPDQISDETLDPRRWS